MAILQLRSNRKATGGRYKRPKVKRMARFERLAMNTKITETKAKSVRTIGGNVKQKLLGANKANIFDTKTKKHEFVEITKAVENPANRHYVRRNMLTKGAIVETAKGKAKVTSRPGQEGMVNATLIQ